MAPMMDWSPARVARDAKGPSALPFPRCKGTPVSPRLTRRITPLRLTPCCTPRQTTTTSRRYGGQTSCQTPSRTPRRSAHTPVTFVRASPCRGRAAPRLNFLDAICRSNGAVVAKVLDEDPFAVCRPVRGTQDPPLMFALNACTSIEVFALLLKGGADVHARGITGLTPLETVAGVHPIHDVGGVRGKWTTGRPEVFRVPGSNISFTTEPFAEEKCIAYASLLLWHGSSKLGEFGDLSSSAAAIGRYHLAAFIHGWSGHEARSFRDLVAAAHNPGMSSKISAARLSVFHLPDSVINLVCDMLAPLPSSS